MAAPAGAYRTKSLVTRNKENTGDAQHLCAILQVDKATMLKRFYLDGIFDVSLENNVDGIIGYCRIGSANFNMHVASRRGQLRIYDSGDCQFMNDAGLNTLAYCNIESIPAQWGNRPKFEITWKASFYSESNRLGVVYRYGGLNDWQDGYISLKLNKDQQVSRIDRVDMDAQIGQDVRVMPYIENDEGRFYGVEKGFRAWDRISQFDVEKRSDPCTSSNQDVREAFMLESQFKLISSTLTDQGSVTGLFVWADEAMTIPLASGYYGGISDKPVECSNGMFTRYMKCAPPVVKKDILASVDSSLIDNPGWPGHYIIYYHPSIILQNGPYSHEVTITGSMTVHNAKGERIAGGSGDSSFNFVIKPGDMSAADDSLKWWVDEEETPGFAFVRASIFKTVPSGMDIQYS